MKGKTEEEARSELEKSGMAADKVAALVPHKVMRVIILIRVTSCISILFFSRYITFKRRCFNVALTF